MRTTSSLLLSLCLVSLCHAQNSADMPDDQWVNNYQQGLAERMLDSGRQFLDQAEFEEAERKFFEALQIVKINNGMASPLQIPVLKLLIESQLPQRDWPTIQQYLSYFDWLNNEIYQQDLQAFLHGSDVLSTLFMSAAADINNPQSAHYLISSKNLNWNAISAIEATYGSQSPMLTPWLYRVVTSHFYQSSLVKRRGMTSYNYKTDEPAIVNGWSLSKNEFIQKSHKIGIELLERIRLIENLKSNAEGAAIAQLYLGDWEALFDNPKAAIRHYQLANDQLLAAGVEQSAIDLFFSQNSVLPEKEFNASLAQLVTSPSINSDFSFQAWSPNFPSVPAPELPEGSSARAYPEIRAVVSFDLSMGVFTELTGYKEVSRTLFTKSNLRLLSITPDNALMRDQALRDVSMLQIRPRLMAGQLVPSEGITVDYIFSTQVRPVLLSDN